MQFQANLTVTITRQGNRYVAYAPALDLATSGKSEAEAKKRFEEVAPLFIEELQEAGTTQEVLTELGWEQSSETSAWQPPVVKSEELQVMIPATV